ncbi:MAG: Hsp20 family protein [Pseudobdellovibrionaceae bacterium]
MAEIGDASNNGKELRDLQETYRRKQRQVREEGEQQVREARSEKQEKVDRERTSGEAAVNHVKKENQERIEQMRNEADNRVTYERKALAKKVENTRNDGTEKINQLKESLTYREDSLKDQLKDAAKREHEAQVYEQKITAKVQQRESERRKEFANVTQEDLKKLEHEAAQEKLKINRQHSLDKKILTERYRQDIEQSRADAKAVYQKQRGEFETRLKQQRDENAIRYDGERRQHLEQQTNMKTQAQMVLQKEQYESEKRLQEVSKINHDQLRREVAKGVQDQEKTRDVYAKEIARLHKEGDVGIHQQIETHDVKKRTLEIEQKQELERLQQHHQDTLIDKDAFYKEKAKQNELIYKQGLADQHREFEQMRQKNRQQFDQVLELQKTTFAKNIMRDKMAHMKDINKYAGKDEDPFYQLKMTNAQVEETDTHYYIKAQVPEHEKDSIKIHVKNDMAVIQGNRRFEDKVQGENARVTTNNYQTFREEFKLEHPVREKMAERFWQNGILTYKIPKA